MPTLLPQEELYRLGIESSPDAVLIEDTEGKILFTNKQFEGLGYISKNIQDYILRHKDQQGKSEIEFEGKRFFESFSMPLVQHENTRIGNIWYFHEITPLKQVEIQLRTEKNTVEKYFHAIGRIVLVLTAEGTILYLNRRGCEILGYQQDQLLGKNWVTEILSKSKKYTLDIFLESVINAKNTSVHFEYSVVNKDTIEEYFTWGCTAIKDEHDVIQSYLCTAEDMSDLRKAEIDIFHLKELDKLKDEFLNIVAHELKTPLTSIITLSDLMKSQKSQLPSIVAGYPDILYEEGMRLKTVVNRILTVTRYESGKPMMHIEHISINTFVLSLLPVLQTLNQKKKYAIRIQPTAEDIELDTDKEQISEVIINFVDNAVKYGPPDQTITVCVNYADNKVGIAVEDQGQGIPPESIHKLFNKFSQLEPSLSRSQEGTGLGLYICKLIVEKLGGTIEVHSEVGKGSKFTFFLPIKLDK